MKELSPSSAQEYAREGAEVSSKHEIPPSAVPNRIKEKPKEQGAGDPQAPCTLFPHTFDDH